MEFVDDYQGGRVMTAADLEDVAPDLTCICAMYEVLNIERSSIAAIPEPMPEKYNSWKVYALLGGLTFGLCVAILLL